MLDYVILRDATTKDEQEKIRIIKEYQASGDLVAFNLIRGEKVIVGTHADLVESFREKLENIEIDFTQHNKIIFLNKETNSAALVIAATQEAVDQTVEMFEGMLL
jgi:hypothetical protein